MTGRLDAPPPSCIGGARKSRERWAHGVTTHIGELASIRRGSKSWPRRYGAWLRATDFVVLSLLLIAYLLIAPLFNVPLDDVVWPNSWTIPYWLAIVVIGLIWWMALDATDSRDEHVIGHGITEYDRVFRGTVATFMVVIAISFFLRIDLARSILVFVFPIGVALLVASRWLWRQWLRGRQAQGSLQHRAVVIGEARKAEHIIQTLGAARGTGLRIIGVITEPADDMPIADVPVLGAFGDLERVVDQLNVDTVVFVGADSLPPKAVRQIGWNMASREVEWIVVPSLTDVAGPRIHSRPMAGLPLVHVSFPRLDGAPRFLKRSFDIVGAALLILALSPVLLAAALAVRLSSQGPVFYSQERVGRNGESFPMLKFRSMVVNADAELTQLLAEQGRTDQPLFKVENDPRITPVGRFIRRYSIDELPQLFNVLRGEMSLVGPRPQRDAEVALYDDAAHRRLMVKPGMSGLWQVSGRSTLSWEDTIRLDLYYVENWSFMQDITILLRTVRAVVAPGASAH